MIWRYLSLILVVCILSKIEVSYGQCRGQNAVQNENTDTGQPHRSLSWQFTPPDGIIARIDDSVNGPEVPTLQNGDWQYDFPIGTTTVYVIDGTTGLECSYMVIVSDMEPPTIMCPVDMIVTEQDKVTWGLPTASDNSGTVTLIQTAGVTLDTRPDVSDSGPVVYVARDPSGLEAMCSFTVTVTPNMNIPQITGCPPREVLSDNTLRVTAGFGEDSAFVTWTEPTIVSSDTSVTVNRNSGSSFTIGSTYVIYTYTFNNGNPGIRECAFYVIVSRFVDTTPPTVSCPADISVVGDVNTDSTVVTWETTIPTDDVAVGFYRFTPSSGTAFPNGVTTVTFKAYDTSNNERSCEFTVTVLAFTDNVAPVIENCPVSFPFFVNDGETMAQVTWSPPTVFDENQWTLTLMDGITNPVTLMVQSSPYTVRYTAVDVAGNMDTCQFEITVGYDDINPTVNCPASVTEYVREADSHIPVSVTWTDPVDLASDNSGEVTVIKSENPGLFIVPGDQVTVTYTARDPYNNIDACTFTLSVLVDPAPTFRFCESESRTIETNANQNTVVYTWNVPTDTVTDVNPEFGGAITTTNTADPPNITPPYEFPLGVTSIVYEATDVRGSTSVCTVTVTVVDMQVPQFTGCPGTGLEFTVFNNTFRSAVVTWTPPVVQDNTATVTVTTNISPGATLPVGNYIVRYTAVDGAGNTGTCSFDVDVLDLPGDNEGPLIMNCPESIDDNTNTGVDFTTVSWTVPTVTDLIDPSPSLIPSHNPGDRFFIGTTTVTYTAVDNRGNIAVCNFEIVIRDQEAPVFDNCPPNVQRFVDLTATQALAKVTEVSATDNSGMVILLNDFQFTVLVADSPVQRVLVARDMSNNERTCSVTVTLTPTSDVLVYPGQVVITQFGGSTVVPTDFTNLQRDLENLFRCSALADDFVGVRIGGVDGFIVRYELSLYSGTISNPYAMRGREISNNIETEFTNALTGTPPRLFDTRNEIQPDSFQLTVCEFRGSFTLVASEGNSTALDVTNLVISGSAAEGLLAQRVVLRLDSIYSTAATLDNTYITSVVVLPFQASPTVANSVVVDFVLVFSATSLPLPSETLVNQEFTDELQFNSAEGRTEIRNSGLFISSTTSVNIVKICPEGQCLNGGTCTISDRFEPSCVCSGGFSGDMCENSPFTPVPPIIPPVDPDPTPTGLSTGAIIGIIAGAVGLLLILLLMALCCCCLLFAPPKGPPIAPAAVVPYEEPVLYSAPPRPRAIAYSAPPTYVAREPYVEMIVPEPMTDQVVGYGDYRRGPIIEEIDSYPSYKREYLGPYF